MTRVLILAGLLTLLTATGPSGESVRRCDVVEIVSCNWSISFLARMTPERLLIWADSGAPTLPPRAPQGFTKTRVVIEGGEAQEICHRLKGLKRSASVRDKSFSREYRMVIRLAPDDWFAVPTFPDFLRHKDGSEYVLDPDLFRRVVDVLPQNHREAILKFPPAKKRLVQSKNPKSTRP